MGMVSLKTISMANSHNEGRGEALKVVSPKTGGVNPE